MINFEDNFFFCGRGFAQFRAIFVYTQNSVDNFLRIYQIQITVTSDFIGGFFCNVDFFWTPILEILETLFFLPHIFGPLI